MSNTFAVISTAWVICRPDVSSVDMVLAYCAAFDSCATLPTAGSFSLNVAHIARPFSVLVHSFTPMTAAASTRMIHRMFAAMKSLALMSICGANGISVS